MSLNIRKKKVVFLKFAKHRQLVKVLDNWGRYSHLLKYFMLCENRVLQCIAKNFTSENVQICQEFSCFDQKKFRVSARILNVIRNFRMKIEKVTCVVMHVRHLEKWKSLFKCWNILQIHFASFPWVTEGLLFSSQNEAYIAIQILINHRKASQMA